MNFGAFGVPLADLTFAWPWMLLLWPLPVLLRHQLRPLDVGSAGLQVRVPTLLTSARHISDGGRAPDAPWLLWCAWTLLCIASARPEALGAEVLPPGSGRDLLLVVDISGSMNTDDMEVRGQAVTRLDTVKQVARVFIPRRIGDRVGLLVFGSDPYLYVPLTFDRTSVVEQLLAVQGGIAGARTAIGDATGLAVKVLRARPAQSRVVILLTDGANNFGELRPADAGAIAARYGVRIYSIGFGADALRMTGPLGFEQLVNPSSDLDENTLRGLAQTTGGRYFRARDPAELAEVYAEIDAIEPVPQQDRRLRMLIPLYPWPLAAAALCALALLARQLRVRAGAAPLRPEAPHV